MNLTTAGINQARKLDSIAYTSKVNGAPIGFSNHTDDYFFSAKLMVDNFLFGVRHWKRTEGFGLYQDIDAAGSRNGSNWSPENTTVYAQYDRQLTEKFSISNLSNFALHRLGKETNRVNFVAFGDPRANLHFAHLLNPDKLIAGRTLGTKNNTFGTEIIDYSSYSMFKHGWKNRYYYYEAQQFRNESRLFYDGERLNFSTGVDFRSTLTQGDYLIYNDYDTNYPSVEAFKAKHGVGLGFMSFFTLAVVRALKLYPDVNSMIDGDFQIKNDFQDISIAVSGPKGLMVPVIRNAENLSFKGVESEVKRLALRARDGQITIDEMTGGTFTITNGGVFGSMLSTPILNPPQSGILGMHNIVNRPMAVNGEVVIRPIMYVALSYDHRIIDGRESVGFLVAVKEALEKQFMGVEVILQDERYTSQRAMQVIHQGGKAKHKKDKGLVDTISATLILQDYLAGV